MNAPVAIASDESAVVRSALVPEDIPALRELFTEYAAGLGIDLCFQDFDAERAALPGRYAAPGGGLWLAIVEGRAAGCIALRSLERDVCEMKRLYVRPAFRGAGVGRLLAETALVEATRMGHARICLDTLPSMRGAIALYRALGFTDIDAYCYNPVEGALFLGRALPFEPASGARPPS